MPMWYINGVLYYAAYNTESNSYMGTMPMFGISKYR